MTVHALGTGTDVSFTEIDVWLWINSMVAPGEGQRCSKQLARFHDALHNKRGEKVEREREKKGQN